MAAAVALVAPLVGSAAAPIPLVQRAGNQTHPSMWGSSLAFVEEIDGVRNVWLAHAAGTPGVDFVPVTALGGVVGGPDIFGSVIAYRLDGTVTLFSALSNRTYESQTAAGAGGVAISSSIVAWDQDGVDGSDVAWMAVAGGEPTVLALASGAPRPGAQHSVAVAYGWIAFIDEGDAGSVHLLDTTSFDPAAPERSEYMVFVGARAGPGRVTDVAIWAEGPTVPPRMAVTVASDAGEAIVVLETAPIVLGSTPSEPVSLSLGGAIESVHLFDAWIAFDDFSSGISQIRLWRWPTGGGPAAELHYAEMTGAPQRLNHLVTAGDQVKVVWTGMGDVDEDIFQFTLDLAEPPESGGDVECTDDDAVVLADFTVTQEGRVEKVFADHEDDCDSDHEDDDADDRDEVGDEHRNDGWHVSDTGAHDERWHSDWKWRAFGGATFEDEVARRVVVCIDATDVAAAWVGVGSRVVAAPVDFRMGTISLEARVTIAKDDGRAGAVVIAQRGGNLRVRVLDDPGGDVNEASVGSTCAGTGDCPPPPRGILAKLGCASSGGAASLASLLLVGLLGARPLRRRSRR